MDEKLQKSIDAFRKLKEENKKKKKLAQISNRVKRYYDRNKDICNFLRKLKGQERQDFIKLNKEQRYHVVEEYKKKRAELAEKREQIKKFNERLKKEKLRAIKNGAKFVGNRPVLKKKETKRWKMKRGDLIRSDYPDAFDYHIFVIAGNRRQELVKRFNDYYEAKDFYDEYVEDNHNKGIKMPIMNPKKVGESKYEIVLVEDIYDKESKKQVDTNMETAFRDEMGKVITYRVMDKDYIILDKRAYYIESKFKVFGYNPKINRKTYQWIVSHFVEPFKDDYLRIYTIKKYVIFEYADESIDVVICDDEYISDMFFSTLLDDYQEYPLISFLGRIRYDGYLGVKLYENVAEYTGYEDIIPKQPKKTKKKPKKKTSRS